MQVIHYHFSEIAHHYKALRTTDDEPVLFIKNKLDGIPGINAADVGCGVGRYDSRFFELLDGNMNLTCIDENESMLKRLHNHLTSTRIKNFQVLKARAKALPLSDNSMDCIFTFNAIHHFMLPDFLKESARVLMVNGLLFIYTRLRSQNKRNIWGRFFPKFHEIERRLYELEELKEIIGRERSLEIESIEYFRYRRMASLDRLKRQALGRHYSTFYLYGKDELDQALEKFEKNILRNFDNPDDISWFAENTMLVLRKKI